MRKQYISPAIRSLDMESDAVMQAESMFVRPENENVDLHPSEPHSGSDALGRFSIWDDEGF